MLVTQSIFEMFSPYMSEATLVSCPENIANLRSGLPPLILVLKRATMFARRCEFITCDVLAFAPN
jgi:hypothetical protein